MIPKGHKSSCNCFACIAHRKGIGQTRRRREAAKANNVEDCGYSNCVLCDPDSDYNKAKRAFRAQLERRG